MADIKGIEGLTVGEVEDHLNRGAKFVVFSYAMSFLVVSLKRTSAVHFVKADENAFVKSLPYTMLSLLLGWWGFPWGFIYTPWAIVQNISGGTDVTPQIRAALYASAPSSGPGSGPGGEPNVTVK